MYIISLHPQTAGISVLILQMRRLSLRKFNLLQIRQLGSGSARVYFLTTTQAASFLRPLMDLSVPCHCILQI